MATYSFVSILYPLYTSPKDPFPIFLSIIYLFATIIIPLFSYDRGDSLRLLFDLILSPI